MKRNVYDYSEWNPDLDVMDDVVFLQDPPEFVLPEWDRPVEIPPWETHDYTSDYDEPSGYEWDVYREYLSDYINEYDR